MYYKSMPVNVKKSVYNFNKKFGFSYVNQWMLNFLWVFPIYNYIITFHEKSNQFNQCSNCIRNKFKYYAFIL